MMMRRASTLTLLPVVAIVGLVVLACAGASGATPPGATPAGSAASQGTAGSAVAVARAGTASPAASVALSPTSQPTKVPDTPTPVPPTATPVPPTPAPTDTPTASPTATLTPAPTATPSPVPPTATATPATAQSWLDDNIVVSIYGRAFGVAPILGRLGMYKNMDAMAADLPNWTDPVEKASGKHVIPAIHLIYALAIPCEPKSDCLLYFEAMDTDLVKDYIEPAQKRGWQVILDSQIGDSTPMDQVQRIINKGYLKYDNVEIALDPEFHVYPGHSTPGIPVGTLEADQINQAQKLVDDYVAKQHLPHKKILMVHQFGDPQVNDGVPFMIGHKDQLKTYPNVDLVIDVDGFGGIDTKVVKYDKITDAQAYPFIKWRAIKIFPPNPYEQAGHGDNPLMSFAQLMGKAETPNNEVMRPPPNMIVVN